MMAMTTKSSINVNPVGLVVLDLTIGLCACDRLIASG